jgi:RNA polymerase sigma factor (sigma-70 family)
MPGETQTEGGQPQESGDRFLIEEIRRGSSVAFRQLVDRFGGRLRRFASRRLANSGLDPDDAVQETFLSLVRNIERLDEVRSLQAFLFTILRCRIADLVRARGPTASALSLDAMGTAVGYDPPAPGNTPSSYARRDEALAARPLVLADALETLLSALKRERRFRDLKILELLFAVGVDGKEAARLASTSEPTVSRTRAQLIDDLRRIIARHPKAAALEDLPAGDDVSHLVRSVWAENLFSCIKRSTLGSYALGVLDKEWADYVRFHLEIAGCEVCRAHLEDVEAGGEGIPLEAKERICASSVGFLKP